MTKGVLNKPYRQALGSAGNQMRKVKLAPELLFSNLRRGGTPTQAGTSGLFENPYESTLSEPRVSNFKIC